MATEAICRGTPHWNPPIATTLSPRHPQHSPVASNPPPTSRGLFHTPSSAAQLQHPQHPGTALLISATTDQSYYAANSATWGEESTYSNSSGNSTLSPYSPPWPTWEATGAAFSFDKEVIYISGNDSTVTLDLDNSLFTMKQPILYTDNGVEELGNIVGIHMEGKCVQPLYTINLKGGKEFRVESLLYHCQQEGHQRRQRVNNRMPQHWPKQQWRR